MLHNFYAGPSIINPEVMQNAIEELQQGENKLSILEVSHRSKRFGAIMEETVSLAKELLGLSNEFEVIFLQGGGRQQFYQIPFNLSKVFHTAQYAVTGTWAQGAYEEAKHFGDANVWCSSEENQFRSLPAYPANAEKSSYYYLCTNNTIYGTQFKDMPNVNAPLIADMSSDLFGIERDFNQFDLFYAATQKNVGTAGACMVALKPSILEKEYGSIPEMIDYRTHIKKQSLYNTPPVFAIVMSLFTLRWIKEQGGIAHFDAVNKQKAETLYSEIDRNELFVGYADKKDRSLVNVVFNAISNELEQRFLTYAEEQGMIGIKGHRSIGGFRASMYNALPLSSAKALADCMKEFERTQA